MKARYDFYKALWLSGLLFVFVLSMFPLYPAEREQDSDREPRGEKPTHADAALKFRRLQMQDENGFIPLDGWEKARQHLRLMKQDQQRRLKQQNLKQPVIGAAGITPNSWEWYGPGNIGGRIRSIVIHPTNPNLMWVGSVSGGIWRTTNGGVSWAPVNDFMANLAVSTMVIHPTNPNIMYAGTGEGFWTVSPPDGFNGDGIQGEGIFQSTDGGATWNQLARTNPADPGICATPANCPWLFVNRLAISPNGATLLAATNNGVWRSTDGGAMWSQVTFVRAADVDFHPTDSQKAMVGELGRAQRSTNGGADWTVATFTPGIANGGTGQTNGRVELAYARSNPTIIYASVNQTQGSIYRSTNDGVDFSQRLVLGHLGGQGWYDNTLWVNPLDPNNVITGGIHLWKSSTGGSSFLEMTGGAGSAHDDHHVIVEHPAFNGTSNRTVYFGNDGGIYRADDIVLATPFSGWTNLNNNLGITQFYGAAVNTNGVVIGGTQDNGTVRFTGSNSWTMPFGGDGGFCAADQTDPSHFYGEYVFLQIYRSTDHGLNFSYIFNGITDANNCPMPGVCNANFIAPFVLDPQNPNRMLAGGLSLWRSNDVKVPAPANPTWNSVPKPNAANQPISAIAISPSNSDFIVVGHNNGDIYRTFNGTAASPAWTKIDIPALPNRMVTRLVIDNTRTPNWIYATFAGFTGDNIYRNTADGTTWTDITGTGTTGLPDVPVRSLVYHPRYPNFLYAGTEVGIFTSEDAGATWELPQDGPANVSVDELVFEKSSSGYAYNLLAVTHGRGIYRASLGIYVDCNYLGFESGTFSEPYRTINAAINASNHFFQTIWIRPCTYNETINANNANDKRFEMRPTGGTVRIAPP